jgi:ATP-dependent Clp protease adapter protein ClpS
MIILHELVTLKDKVVGKAKSAEKEIELNKPGGFNIMILNNPVTPFEVVVEALMSVLGLSEAEAHKRMMRAHKGGWACVATYGSKDVAETKANAIERAAANNKGYDRYRKFVKYNGPWPLDVEVMEAGGD